MPVKLLSATIATNKPDRKNNWPGKPVTETLTNGFFSVDHKWTVKYWNQSAEKILGVKAKDIIGKNLWEKFAGVIPLEFYAVDQNAFMQDVPVHFEEYWGEMGAWFDVITYHCDNTLSVSFKSSNHPHTEYPEGPVQRLKILTELYRFVTEITNDCLWEWNLLSGEIFWIDGGHKRIFGYQVENALIPQSFWESRIHPEDKLRVLAGIKQIIAEGKEELWEETYRFQKANGEYAFVHDRGHIVYDEDNQATRMIGATRDISDKVLLEKKLEVGRLARQREITEAVLTAQENERAELGGELYDNLNQILAVTKIYIGMAKKYKNKREAYLEKSSDFIVKVMYDIKRITKTLATPGLVIGLVDSIKNLLEDFVLTNKIKIVFDEKGIDESLLDEKLQLNIFRIVQGQMSNIHEHANATCASINLSRHGDEIVLVISDNGDGLDIHKDKKGVGIINIESRAELYHGSVTIDSKPGKGYELRVAMQCPPVMK